MRHQQNKLDPTFFDVAGAEIREALLADEPDLTIIQASLKDHFLLSQDLARQVLYRVILGINTALFPPITKLELILTESCNLACVYCFETRMLGHRSMPPHIARAAIDLLFDYSGEEQELGITLFGGEPMLNMKGIQDVIKYAEAKAITEGKSVQFNMTSNGVLIDEARAEYFAQHKIMVLLSIDGLQDTHDRYRKDKLGRGTFERVLHSLRILKSTQRWVGVKMTVMPEGVSRLFEDVVALHELGVNQFIIGYASGIQWPEDDIRVYIDQWCRIQQWYKAMPQTELRITDAQELGENTGDAPFFGCQAGKVGIAVTVNGEISPCAKILSLDKKLLLAKLGNVHHGLTHLKNRSELVSCRRLIEKCGSQGIAADYQGGCWANNYTDNLDMFQPSLQDYTFDTRQRAAFERLDIAGEDGATRQLPVKAGFPDTQ